MLCSLLVAVPGVAAFFSFFLFHISRISWRVFFKPCTSDAWERRVNNNNGDAVNLISTRAWLIYFACNLFGWTLVGREASTREREENLFFRLYRVYFVEVSSNRRKSKFQLNVVQGSQIEFHPKSEGETREATAQQRRRRIWYSMWDCTNLYTFLMKFTVFAVVRKKKELSFPQDVSPRNSRSSRAFRAAQKIN